MGIIGTWEGFVVSSYDVYNRGTWGIGYGQQSVVPINISTGHIRYNSNNIYNYRTRNSTLAGFGVEISNQGNNFNLQPYKSINIVYSNEKNSSQDNIKLYLRAISSIMTRVEDSITSERTISLNISSFNGVSTIVFTNEFNTGVTGGVYIYIEYILLKNNKNIIKFYNIYLRYVYLLQKN